VLCVDLETNAEHCGRCNHACPGTQVCSMGNCADTCQSGLVDCSTTGTPCANIDEDPSNCGFCGHSCGAPIPNSGVPVCQGGQCEIPCNSGYTLCDSACVDYMNDPNNCGTCAHSCEGLTCCQGHCIDTTSDDQNCGYCGDVCGAFNCCAGSSCGFLNCF
jgi:hypothetical protein